MIANTTRRLLSLNKFALRFGFCFNKATLDPYKHTTMNHNPHNIFVDLYDFGEYPEIIAPSSIAPRTYQPVVVSTAVDILNKRFGTTLTAEDFNNNLDKTWSRFILKDLKSEATWEEVITPILNRLALDIFVRESRWTWVKEQKERLRASTAHFASNKPETLGEFLEQYNELIEQLVLASTMGFSPYIPQATTALEKHYIQEMSETGSSGVYELNNLKGEENNFINKAMGLLHRL